LSQKRILKILIIDRNKKELEAKIKILEDQLTYQKTGWLKRLLKRKEKGINILSLKIK